jgi:hypothetical protein
VKLSWGRQSALQLLQLSKERVPQSGHGIYHKSRTDNNFQLK